MKMSDPHDRKNIFLFTDGTFCKFNIYIFFFWGGGCSRSNSECPIILMYRKILLICR